MKLDNALRRVWRGIIRPSPRGRVRWAVFFVVVLGISAAVFDAPYWFNRGLGAIRPALGYAGIQIPNVPTIPFRLGLDLQGGAQLVYEADMKDILEADRDDALGGVRDVVERRVNAFGVAEPLVQSSRVGDSYRMVIELAGISDIGEAIRQIGETPILEFKEESVEPSRPLTPEEEMEMNKFNKEVKKSAEDILKKALAPEADFALLAKEFSEDEDSKPDGGSIGFIRPGQTVEPFEKAAFALKVGETGKTLVESQFGYHIIMKTDERETDVDGEKVPEVKVSHILFQTKSPTDIVPPEPWKNTALSGKQLKRAGVSFDPNTNEAEVSLQFDAEGAKLFSEITERNVGKPVAIFLDGAPITVPRVTEKITGGQAVITGNFSVQDAKLLAQRLNAGALPVPISIISEQRVGASLGQESVNKSLVAGLWGFALVALFMIAYYRLPGLLSVLSLGIYAVVVLALFKLIPVTLSMAGIAGLILSLGMAVDANVLIFERLKEELRSGKPLGQAIDEGFRRAWTSIRDGNLTTLIAAGILFWFSSSTIKGFALTLSVGVLVSMFSALVVTRSFLRLISPWFKKKFWYGV
ncbi:protein-export membrane protein SecD [Candidatus Uhrbacteria bacterium RIFCSPHIGHO2_02_FULL_57_19]|uniref:Protein translocase subunit SecD n=1 Tax=Candidatus Uhrbacteria bacterium RIFCSPHIGHO2_02_FULL_57_19 TaxID=1802391 RepID=A0A1F7U5H5_9BACT|nr:MAG: protein-export membrane protein SecD [Candidatus Uhrbacteria bacterium RIFCSPHIGHO2_02_FULL_57_19]